ncbi:MAG TPA: hypothetical protein VJT14_00345 [Candidatus Dormibacteraeota bacterium]|nr:hypothetical protein [Candidatus Dormibacteraeota bacterium]
MGGVRAKPKLNSHKEDDSAHERSNDRSQGSLPPISGRHGGNEGDAHVRDDEKTVDSASPHTGGASDIDLSTTR